MASTTSSLLKTDALGRLRKTRLRREELLDEFGRSGLSGAQFADLAGGSIPPSPDGGSAVAKRVGSL